jgi:hypothetical protein
MHPVVLMLQYCYTNHQHRHEHVSAITSPSSGSTSSCIQGVSEETVNILGGGIMDSSE